MKRVMLPDDELINNAIDVALDGGNYYDYIFQFAKSGLMSFKDAKRIYKIVSNMVTDNFNDFN